MNDIFAKDLSGEMVSPDEPGYDELITDIFATIKTTQIYAKITKEKLNQDMENLAARLNQIEEFAGCTI